jgi:subtilisin family serine protease
MSAGAARRLRSRYALLALALGAALAVGSVADASQPPPRPEPVAKVAPEVLAELSNAGETTFWAILTAEADLSTAKDIADRTARGEFVVDELKGVADGTQASLLDRLDQLGVAYKPFWITNAVEITAGESVLQEVAARPEVAEIVADPVYQLPQPTPGEVEQAVATVEWNIDRIRAPEAWSTFGARGEGIVVANIDTGVQFNHPALVAQYRGNRGGGVFDHNYNWFDPARICGNPSLAPCDNNGHGTHTMGTMVGDDGDPGTNQIGVAPHARWIAAKGCETTNCTLASLLAAGQWVLAPTDLNGANPRADLRPHIVNNSWGGASGDPFYQATVDAWVASGIFPVFASGNPGSTCGAASAPGNYLASYSVGSFDNNNNIAGTSGRGPSAITGAIKPNIAAPGVNVRSSLPNNTYGSFSGTSMATPHVAGTVALMWSSSTALVGDVAATRALLDSTAIDTSDLTCGGTANNNNVWGEGRLDAFAAVAQAPHGPAGTLTGSITNAVTGAPLAGARVTASGTVSRATTTGANGTYSIPLPVGVYDVTASLFGFGTAAAQVQIAEGIVTPQDFALQPAPVHAVSGHVRDEDQPTVGATVTIVGTPIPPVTTGTDGTFAFPSVPEGEYVIRAEGGACVAPLTHDVVVDADQVVDFDLPRRPDAFGYFCRVTPAAYLEATDTLPLTGDDAAGAVPLPFAFPFYGQFYSTVNVSTNGLLSFLAPNTVFANVSIPSTAAPNAAIYTYWDDLFVDASASVRTSVLGTAPARRFVIEWRNVRFVPDTGRRVDAEVVLHENGHILMQYRNIAADDRERGNSATFGIENETGTIALQYGFNQTVLGAPTFAVLYRLPPSAFVEGTVTDANDHLPIAGATVRALQEEVVARQTTTDATGHYRLQVRLGTYVIEASSPNYRTEATPLAVDQEDVTVVQDIALSTPRGVVSPLSLQVIAPPNETRTRMLTLRNTGSVDMTWDIVETTNPPTPVDVPWLSESPTSGPVPAGGSTSIAVGVNTGGLAAGVHTATMLVRTNSGRQPTLAVPVELIVPAYSQAVDVGGGAYVDLSGDSWAADRAYVAGSWGYTARSARVVDTRGAISGTDEDTLYRTEREDPMEYRFDGLPSGMYEVDLRFAEITHRRPGRRMFDVIAEGTLLLPALDVAGKVGTWAADHYLFYVPVTDGQLNVRFVPRSGFGQPMVSAIQVLERPDK